MEIKWQFNKASVWEHLHVVGAGYANTRAGERLDAFT